MHNTPYRSSSGSLHHARDRGSAARRLCLISVLLLMSPAFAEASTVTVAWDPNKELDVAGYLVYFGTQSGNYAGYVDVGLATTALMNAADSKATYYFAVAAYSRSGLRSALSAEVSWTPSTPSLLNPGSQTSTVGQNVRLQLSATDPRGLALTYGASGLPSGLSIALATGVISGVPSKAGAYTVTAVATNTAGAAATQLFTWSILAQPGSATPIGAVDSIAPTISITSPASGGRYTTNTATISLKGTLSDNVGVVSVTWRNDRGGQGAASFGTSSWSVSAIELKNGLNLLTVTAIDAAGNSGSATLSVISKVTGKK